jgi:flagellar motor switch protein FliN/FliY
MQDLTPSEIEALTQAMGGHLENRQTSSTIPFSPSKRNISQAQFSQFSENETFENNNTSSSLDKVEVEIEAVLGSKSVPLKELLNLTKGSIIDLDQHAGDLIEIRANGELIAKGEVVVVDDRFGVRLIELF